jgi:hypothetical protein
MNEENGRIQTKEELIGALSKICADFYRTTGFKVEEVHFDYIIQKYVLKREITLMECFVKQIVIK